MFLLTNLYCLADDAAPGPKWPEHIQIVLDNTKPLQYPREHRLPLYLWQAMDPGQLSDEDALLLVTQLDRRGIGLICSWTPKNRRQSLANCLPVAKAQQKLHLPVNINATSCLYSFFDGDEKTAHIDSDNKPFWDTSFGSQKMGCPFALDHRREPMRERIQWYVDKYKQAGLPIDFVFADWEVDGPLEWNDAWQASKKCRRCRDNIPNLDTNFLQFQKTLRDIRSDLQRYTYAQPLRQSFPNVLVGNYAVYPNDGFRYWYDYFEKYVDGQPALTEQNAHYRHWANEFDTTGYTFAMPTVYPWCWTWHWYDFKIADYRWFYNMLKVATNAATHTNPQTPIITFVHWHTVMVGSDADKTATQQFSEQNYQELLWHMLLRGHDTFFLWCVKEESPKEIALLHQTWAAAQQFGQFLEHGTPICFDVPSQPSTIISGLQLNNKVLIRRTDFTENTQPVKVAVGTSTITIPPTPGRCLIIDLQ
jgi:hypothetical protein